MGISSNYEYDVFGKVVRSSGARAGELRFGFSTKYHDREVGLISYQRRFYHPGVGRWLNRDPIEEEGGENVYCFVENSPSWLVDFGGLHTFQFNDKGWSSGNVSQNNGGVLGVTSFSIRSGSECKCVSGKYSPEYTFVLDVYSMVQDADDSKWDDDEYGDTIRDPRVKSKWNSFWFFESRRRRNLVIEHEERHRQHARKNYDVVIDALSASEQYSSKSVCEANAREKIAAAVKLFNLMDNADAEKVERGEL
ncbi:MAG: RHS repeat-associated core domain-containing protein [Kiritimatiellae bacterium]|nr:RHS repeat-associated core domain-containing protein [Kiritimatiellia bacterium]